MPKYLTSLRGEWRIALPGRRKSGREISRDTRRPVFAVGEAHARRERAREGRGSRPRDEVIDAVITKCDRRHEARNLPL